MNLVQLLQNIGCKNARNDGMDRISSLRDGRWVEMFAEMGYDRGEFIFPDGRHSSFFLVLPDGNIASADNVMCGNGFYAVANDLGIDADEILGKEPYGEFITYTDVDGIEDEDTAITIWTPEDFIQKLKMCHHLSQGLNESIDMGKCSGDMYTMEDWTNDRTLKVKPGQCIDDDVYEQLRDALPPAYLRRGIFQPGEAYSTSVDYEDLYQTFVRQKEGWLYVGLCKYGETAPTEQIDFYKNMQESKKNKKKNTVRLTESELKSLIAESVKNIIKESTLYGGEEELQSIINAARSIQERFDYVNDDDYDGVGDYDGAPLEPQVYMWAERVMHEAEEWLSYTSGNTSINGGEDW